MKLKMISMLMIASALTLFCTACDDDDEPTKENEITICPNAPFQGKVTTTAFGVTLEPTDWTIDIANITKESLSLVFGEFSIVVPMPGGKTITRTIKRCAIDNVGYEDKDDVLTFAPGEFVTTDGVFETIKYEILSGSITAKGMKLSMKVQPEGMPMPMILDFTTFEE